MSLADAVATLRQYLPAGAILVGQNVGKDVEWLKLREGADFKVPSAMSMQALSNVRVFRGSNLNINPKNPWSAAGQQGHA